MVWFELVTRGLLQNEVSAILTIHKAEKNAERGNGEWKNLSSKFPAVFSLYLSLFLQVLCIFLSPSFKYKPTQVSLIQAL